MLVMWVAQQHDVKRTLRKPCEVTRDCLKKGLKKGKYKIKIKLTALGSKNLGYNTASKRVTVAVNVK